MRVDVEDNSSKYAREIKQVHQVMRGRKRGIRERERTYENRKNEKRMRTRTTTRTTTTMRTRGERERDTYRRLIPKACRVQSTTEAEVADGTRGYTGDRNHYN